MVRYAARFPQSPADSATNAVLIVLLLKLGKLCHLRERQLLPHRLLGLRIDLGTQAGVLRVLFSILCVALLSLTFREQVVLGLGFVIRSARQVVSLIVVG